MLEEKKEELQQWIQKADGDLKVAKKLYNSEGNEDILWIICFHCQQAIEKYFKAYLIAYGKERIKYTHNLIELLDECKSFGKLFDELDREYLDEVSVYAVHGRYPFFTGNNIQSKKLGKQLTRLKR